MAWPVSSFGRRMYVEQAMAHGALDEFSDVWDRVDRRGSGRSVGTTSQPCRVNADDRGRARAWRRGSTITTSLHRVDDSSGAPCRLSPWPCGSTLPSPARNPARRDEPNRTFAFPGFCHSLVLGFCLHFDDFPELDRLQSDGPSPAVPDDSVPEPSAPSTGSARLSATSVRTSHGPSAIGSYIATTAQPLDIRRANPADHHERASCTAGSGGPNSSKVQRQLQVDRLLVEGYTAYRLWSVRRPTPATRPLKRSPRRRRT